MMKSGKSKGKTDKLVPEEQARREFLKNAGRFAVVTPPSIALLLGTSLNSQAIAASHGARPGHGWGSKKRIHSGGRKR
ncbi:hypothetical protein [Mesorhizobium sp.]|uniref:hypothetical protein n=1 Tax=Mesorhizobium sp. TaxID=1871066 RepID=UPI000FE8D09A|nr:hypothetical protein [Mesorhizobium sp.]RWO26652.1 MAG: hypothetical protein EOS09_08840 [Mesorhizobium sp.]